MVFVAAKDLLVGEGTRYAGCRVPEAADWNPYTRSNHIAQGRLRDVSEEEADRMYVEAQERIRDMRLKRAAKQLVKAELRANQATAALKMAEERYESAMAEAEDAEQFKASLVDEIAALENGPLPELGNPGPSARKIAKEKARKEAEAAAKAAAEAEAKKASEVDERKQRKAEAKAARAKRREELADMSVVDLKDLAKAEDISGLPTHKADIVAHIASELDRREILAAHEETSADG